MANQYTKGRGVVTGRVTHGKGRGPLRQADVFLLRTERKGPGAKEPVEVDTTVARADGSYSFNGPYDAGDYKLRCVAFGRSVDSHTFGIDTETNQVVDLDLELGLAVTTYVAGEGGQLVSGARPVAGRRFMTRVEMPDEREHISGIRWNSPMGAGVNEMGSNEAEFIFGRPGPNLIEAIALDRAVQRSGGHAEAMLSIPLNVGEPEISMIGGHVGVTLHRTASDPTLDQALWVAIRNRTHAIGFHRYRDFMNKVLRLEETERLPEMVERRVRDLGANMHGVGVYNMLKLASEVFLMLECGIRIEPNRPDDHFPLDPLEERTRLGQAVTHETMRNRLQEYLGPQGQLPYITRVVEAAFPEFERLNGSRDRVFNGGMNEPCLIELIWNYWHEEGMLMQTMNAITRRFQNARGSGERDPLANVEIDPLRPLNNLLWGYVQDEVNRLSVKRRAYEYMHQYGLVIYGRATPGLMPADNRSKFLEAFHNLLYQASVFFKEDFQTTVIADGFPLLNSLQEVHMVLAEGAHNQFGDLAWTARVEMMLAEYMLARPEIREFLQSRAMVPYKEPWMPQVDSMKTLQGWTDVSVAHFRDLGVYGEQLLLSIRYGDWIHVNNEDAAKNWARYWRPEIQGYMHAYRVATGVDIPNSDTVDSTIPGILLQRRLATQQSRMRA